VELVVSLEEEVDAMLRRRRALLYLQHPKSFYV